MARRAAASGGGAAANPFGPITAMAIGALIFIAIIIFGPYLAGTIEGSTPPLAPDSDFNKTNNADLPSGADSWVTFIGLLTLCGVVVVFTVAFAYFKGML